jgi:hypothetical protein
VGSMLRAKTRLALIFLSANLGGEAPDRLSRCDPTDFIDKPILPVLIRRALQTAERAFLKDKAGRAGGTCLRAWSGIGRVMNSPVTDR